MNIKSGEVINAGPIKDGPALHGADIGSVGITVPPIQLEIDLDRLDDNWVPITGPAPFGPTWLTSGKQGWIKVTWLKFAPEPPVPPVQSGKKYKIEAIITVTEVVE